MRVDELVGSLQNYEMTLLSLRRHYKKNEIQ